MTNKKLLVNNNSVDAWSKMIPTAAYIHLPFCRRRCYYCDFPITVVGQGNSASVMIADYLEALIKDIRLTKIEIQQPLTTVFFGGGTPSLIAPKDLAQILQTIAQQFGIADGAEISLEIDPGTFDRDRLRGYLGAGINRFSLGVQTFEEKLLQVCGRSHTLAEVMQAVEIFKQLNIDNFSLDLISGLPYQTLEHCQTSLEQAMAIAPKHLSCYDLVLEPVTAFGKQYQPGETPMPNDDDTAEMYRLTQRTLTAAGYEHYEISNYARSGYQCRHNRVYWKNKSYYGFGMGAASYVDGIRYTRPRTRREYFAWLKADAPIEAPKISAADCLLETLMLGLRLTEGVDLTHFDRQTVQEILSCLKPYEQQGWIEIITDGKPVKLKSCNSFNKVSGKLRLKDPEGFLFSNTILAALFKKLD